MTELRNIKIEGFVSDINSSTTPLSASAKFSGAAVEILNYGIVFISVYTDVASAEDGLSIQQSIDGINWDFSDDYTINAGGAENFSINPHAKYLKVDFTNGLADQGVGGFRLQTILKGDSKPSSHSIKGDITNDDDATLGISVLKVQTNDETTYKNVDVQNPLPTDGDSVYGKDLDLARTVTTGWAGDVSDLFGDLTKGLVYSGATNPKNLTIYFRRTIVTSIAGFGAEAGNFSNTKIVALLSGGAEYTVHDGSADNTDKTSETIQFIPIGVVGFRVEFHTADDVNLTNFVIIKLRANVSGIQGIDPSGATKNIGSTSDGNLKITDAEDGLAIAKGQVTGTSFIHKFGGAPDFDSSDEFVSVWDGARDGVSYEQMKYQYSATNDIDTISSTAAGDTQDIEIQGLDVNYDVVTQTKALNGTNKVTLDTPLVRVFRMKNVGSTDLVGTVFCYVDTTITTTPGEPDDQTKIRSIISLDLFGDSNNQTVMAIYTIPAGFTGYMRDWYSSLAGSSNQGDVVRIKLVARPLGQVFHTKHISAIVSAGTSMVQHIYVEPEVFTEKTDIEMRAATDTTISAVSAGFDIVLVAD